MTAAALGIEPTTCVDLSRTPAGQPPRMFSALTADHQALFLAQYAAFLAAQRVIVMANLMGRLLQGAAGPGVMEGRAAGWDAARDTYQQLMSERPGKVT